jgi:hypothetical protein
MLRSSSVICVLTTRSVIVEETSLVKAYYFSGVGRYFGGGGKAPWPGVAVLPQSGGQVLPPWAEFGKFDSIFSI